MLTAASSLACRATSGCSHHCPIKTLTIFTCWKQWFASSSRKGENGLARHFQIDGLRAEHDEMSLVNLYVWWSGFDVVIDVRRQQMELLQKTRSPHVYFGSL